MVLSVSAAFAADDVAADTIAIDDETSGGVISTDVDDNAELSEAEPATQDSAPVVTKDTFKDYFDDSGALTSNATELVFEGDFSDLNVSSVMVAKDKPVKFTGKDATFKNVQFMIMQSDVTIDGFNFVTDENNTNSRLIWIASSDEISNIVLSNNNIQFIAPNGTEAYAIYAGAEEAMGSAIISGLSIINNNFIYVGKDETKINNVIRVNGDTFEDYEASDSILVEGNTFDIAMPAIPQDFDMMTWEMIPLSEGIVFFYCDNVTFSKNKVNLKYNKVGGAYDTINVVSARTSLMAKPCNNVIIKDNEINATGHSCIYTIKLTANNFEVSNNILNVTTDDYLAHGISIDGPASNASIAYNYISLYGDASKYTTLYGIYAWQSYGAISNLVYDNNFIGLDGYLACGMELNQPDGVVSNSAIVANGNFTYGVAASIRPEGKILNINNNSIVCSGNNIGFGSGDSILQTASAGISTLGNAIISGNEIFSTAVGIVSVDKGNVVVDDNAIFVNATGNTDNYAITANGVDSLNITNNEIIFDGNSNGTQISDALFVKGIDDVVVSGNDFDITIPSCGYNYDIYDNPAKGIVFSNAAGLTFENNDVNLKYAKLIGSWDTINVVELGYNVDDAVVANNKIMALGGSYIYGIKTYGKNFTINDNSLTILSDVNYVNGIDCEDAATGIVKNNEIYAIGEDASYPIYSGMYGYGNLDVDYINNSVYGRAYYVVAVELGGANENVINNTIIADGNYTIGVGSNSENNTISGNIIRAIGNCIGNQSVWDNFGLVTTGVKILKANATISDNFIEAKNGDYAIDLVNTDSTVDNNYVASKKAVGASAIVNAGASAVITNNTPSVKTVISAPKLYTQYVDGVIFPVCLLDENGDPIANASVTIAINFVHYNATTDSDGCAVFVQDLDAGAYDVTVSFYGDKTYGPKSVKTMIIVDQSPSEIVAPASTAVYLTAVKLGSYVQITLKDLNDNGLANQTVAISFNGKTGYATTNALGVIKYKLNANKAGTYVLGMKFAGDNNYVGSEATTKVLITKQKTKITAAKKAFKAKTKVKKYAVILTNNKGKAIKKVKLTLVIKGKKYKAVTNSKGKATFLITKFTKVGNFKAKVVFAGNAYYKAVSKAVKITVKK